MSLSGFLGREAAKDAQKREFLRLRYVIVWDGGAARVRTRICGKIRIGAILFTII
jgi:hypothetical protein